MIRYHAAVRHLLTDPNKVRPHPANPNQGDTDAIIDSIITNGCYRPIYADADGTILAGHHLYAALLELGATQIPVMFLDSEGDEGIRILLADNKIAKDSRLDHGLESALLQQLDDYVGTGYTEEEAMDLLKSTEDTSGLGFGDHTEDKTPTCPQCGYIFLDGVE